jgi:predicted permease
MPEWKEEIRRRLSGTSIEAHREAEIVEELAQHLEDRYLELLASGVAHGEAYAAALGELNDTESLIRGLRRIEQRAANEPVILGSARRMNMLGDLLQDLRYGARMLRKNIGFTTVAVLSLALGVGANTAIFQLLDAVRLRALPVRDPHEIAEVRIQDMTGARGSFNSWRPSLTNPIWERIRDNQQAFSGLFAWGTDGFNLATGGEVRNAQGLWVSGDFFDVLGVRPILGRAFTASDDRRGCGLEGVVISYSFWQREFGGDASVVGKKITLDYQPVEIIGVTPASFFGLEIGQNFDVALPICAEGALRGVDNRLDAGTSWWLTVMGRLKEGWSIDEATAHLASISPAIFEASLPANYPAISVEKYLGFKLEALNAPSGVSQLRETYATPLWLLLAIAGLVLLIACANLANLMLARASVREREIAIRLALGASRGRLIRQLLAESLLLAGVGAALGALLAQLLSRFVVSYLSTQGNQLFVDLGLDWPVLAFTAGLAILTCVLFGLAPAFRATQTAPGAVMKSGGRGLTAGRERFSLRRALVVSQVALSLTLVAAALLFTRSLSNLNNLDVGFEQDGILVSYIDSSRIELPQERRLPFKRDLLDRIKAIPGVDSAATTNVVPLSGNAWGNNAWLDGADSSQQINTALSRVSPGYFKTMGTPLLAGRDFSDSDADASTKYAIVNESFARKLSGEDSVLGRRFWIEKTPYDPERQYEIVGVVKDTKYDDIHSDFAPIAFLSMVQAPRFGTYDQVLIRSNEPMAGLVSSIKRAVGEVSPEINISFQVLQEQIHESLLRERLMATLSGFFGLLALLLASIGLYGIMSYGVASRTNEIGIRMALGAGRASVLWLVMREALFMTLAGVAVGVPVVLAGSKFISSLLFDLSATDPVSITLASLFLIAVAVVAGYLPARRAARVDPMVALRYE